MNDDKEIVFDYKFRHNMEILNKDSNNVKGNIKIFGNLDSYKIMKNKDENKIEYSILEIDNENNNNDKEKIIMKKKIENGNEVKISNEKFVHYNAKIEFKNIPYFQLKK